MFSELVKNDEDPVISGVKVKPKAGKNRLRYTKFPYGTYSN